MRGRSASAGFTITELMIVVVIIGVLAAVASVAYGNYLRKGRAAEATTLLGNIGMREDAYRSEFATYCTTSTSGSVGTTGAWPTASPTTGRAAWDNGAVPSAWNQLGVRPTSDVWYRYTVVTGAPGGAAPPGQPGYAALPNQDIWYVAEAYGDLDRDGTLSTFHLFSAGTRIEILPSSRYETE